MTTVDEIYAVDATKRTPSIRFNMKSGELSITGKSLPEYSYGFYNKILDEVDEYVENAQALTTLSFNVEYLNTISSKIIMQLILKFEHLLGQGKEVKILWHCHEEDDMMIEMGDILTTTTKIPLEILKMRD